MECGDSFSKVILTGVGSITGVQVEVIGLAGRGICVRASNCFWVRSTNGDAYRQIEARIETRL